ncbi:hypothetical protein [Sphingomonas sp. KR3-1]|uniref:hypothetical protein n=1 Tax=Sphingomonas sp. KR3-1 TaxID=3156611 RepID=UPI0032B5E825
MIALALALVLAAPAPASKAAPVAATDHQLLAGRSFTVSHKVRRRRTQPSDDGNLPPELRLYSTLVQIARPASASERAWNAAMQAWLREGEELAFPGETRGFGSWEGPGQVEVEIALVAASPELLIARLGVSTNFGGPHPNYTSRTMLWSVPLARPLRNAEVFTDVADRGLREMVLKHFDQDGCELPDLAQAKFVPLPNEVVFEFDPYEIGGYTCGGKSGFGWDEAAPYLRQPLPFDRSKLELPATR